MYHFASSKSDAILKHGPGFKPFLLDHKLRLFILIDGVVSDKQSQAMADKMTHVVHSVLRQNHRFLDSYAKVPSYANRIRASMLMDMAVHEAKVAVGWLGEDGAAGKEGTISSIMPSLTIVAMGHFSALIAFGANSGVYHIRNHVVRLLTITDAKARAGGGGADAHSREAGEGITKSTGPTSKSGVDVDEDKVSIRTSMLDMDLLPGDHLLLASDGLISDVGKGRQLVEIFKGENTSDVLGRLVDHGSGVIQGLLVSGILIKSIGVPRDPIFVAKLEPLRKVALFRKFKDPELKKMLSLMKVQALAAGQQIRSSGDNDWTLYVCLAGRLDLFQGDQKIEEISPTTEATQFGLMHNWASDIRFVAALPTKMLIISPDSVRWIRDNEPSIAGKIFWEIMRASGLRSRMGVSIAGGSLNSPGGIPGLRRTPVSSRVKSVRPVMSLPPLSPEIGIIEDESSRHYTQPPSSPASDEGDISGL